MACSCGCSPCNCSPAPVTCCTPTTESVEYTFENGNLIGIGVFDNDTNNLVQLRGIASSSPALTVALNVANKAVILDFDGTLLVADIPDATETQRGILEVATLGETNAGALDDKIITPLKLAGRTATETRTGIAEIATQVEVNAGTDDERFVTSAKLTTWITTQAVTKTFANGALRASSSPAFEGQFGAQQDNDTAWLGYSTGLGQWRPILTGNAPNDFSNLSTTVTLTGGIFSLSGGTTGTINISDFSALNVSSTIATFGNCTTTIGAGSWDWSSTTEVRNGGVAIPANSVLITSATTGVMSSTLINTFLSTANTQVYGLPTSTLNRTTFATYAGQIISNPPTQAEVQALDDAVVIVSQRLGAVITDLMNTVKPHAT